MRVLDLKCKCMSKPTQRSDLNFIQDGCPKSSRILVRAQPFPSPPLRRGPAFSVSCDPIMAPAPGCDEGAFPSGWRHVDALLLGTPNTGKSALSVFLGTLGKKVAPRAPPPSRPSLVPPFGRNMDSKIL